MADAAAAELVLASASPRRLELLRLVDLDPHVRPVDVDETPGADERPSHYVARVAQAKARAAARGESEVVLAADTTVAVDGVPLGKPRDHADATAMLRRLSGRTHHVSTGVSIIDTAGDLHERVVTTEVVFASLSDAAIASYVASGEPLGKAGAYAIQGRGAALVERIDGSWTNVVGLPLVECCVLLRTAGVAVA